MEKASLLCRRVFVSTEFGKFAVRRSHARFPLCAWKGQGWTAVHSLRNVRMWKLHPMIGVGVPSAIHATRQLADFVAPRCTQQD